MFSMLDIQTERHLKEDEVREINFIIKTRARRYIAAGAKDWLYPERYVSKSDWANYGRGYLLMPDPRGVRFTREIIMGFKDGTATAFDEYGRRPWDPNYKQPTRGGPDEWYTFHKFQGEFARLFGRKRRGRACHGATLDRGEDPEDFHQYHLSLEKLRR